MKLKMIYFVSTLFLFAGCNLTRKNNNDDPQNKQCVRVVNVLSKELYDDAHIKHSIHVDFADLEKTVTQWEKETPIVVYCSNYTCTASAMAAQMLRTMGFSNVMAYEGGMAEWYQLYKEDPTYEFEGPAQQEYLTAVVPKPSTSHNNVKIISAVELKKLLNTKNAPACSNPMGCCSHQH